MIATRPIVVGLALASVAASLWLILPLATNDERTLLIKMARSEPVTTCIAAKTVKPLGVYQSWSGSTNNRSATEIARARWQSTYRNASLALDAEAIIDNFLKLDCEKRASLSTPSFFGRLAFVQITDERERITVVYEKTDRGWEFEGKSVELMGIPVI